MSIVQRSICLVMLLTGLLWLTACTGLPESGALKIYQLPEVRIASTHQAVLPFSLRINTPYAGLALNSSRLMVNTQGEQLSSYHGVRWSDSPTILLREHLAVAFARYGGLINISTDEHALHADMHLGSDLRRFQVTRTGSPRVVIELDARVINPGSRRILTSHTFIVEQPLPDVQISHVIEAFGIAANQLAEQIIHWVHTYLQSDKSS
jgi:cholesterol transport system auxiliary component